VVRRGRGALALAIAAAVALTMSACGSSDDNNNPSTSGSSGGGAASVKGDPWILGTTDTVTAIDPAGAYDQGSWTLEYNLYQTPLTIPPGQTTPTGDAAKSCDYTDPKTFTCKLNTGLTFSNGDALTSSDVKYSLDRSIKIADPVSSISSLLGTVDSIDTPDPTTVVFHLTAPDQTFQYVLTTPAAAIVDEQVFPADKLLADDQIIGSGPYKLSQYKPGEQAVLEANSAYRGPNPPSSPQVFVSYYKESSALKLAVQNNDVDVAWRSLSPTDIESLKGDSNVTVAEGDGAEIRYWVWHFQNPVAQDPAVRQAAAMIIDRAAIADRAYSDTVTPMYSIVPPTLTGSNEAFKTEYGANPDVAGAKQLLASAGVQTPVAITMGYTPSHYGPNTVDEASEFKRELESSGLFKVSIKSAEWDQYQVLYKQGAYDLFNLGWFPDYVDADNYLAPFMVDGGFFENGYKSARADKLVGVEKASTKKATRDKAFGQLQDLAAKDVPFIPSWVGKNIAVYGPGMSGVEDTLDPAFIFRMWLITKNG
jgi:peptide/nickel transport system substrate-binding protein